MSCLNNCYNCEWQRINKGQEGWCYAFREEPDGQCFQFKMKQNPTYHNPKDYAFSREMKNGDIE